MIFYLAALQNIPPELKEAAKIEGASKFYFFRRDLAKKKFPGSLVNLDSLCKRFDINLNKRKFHGALIDAVLLSDVYVELIGGKQTSLTFGDNQILESSDKITNVFSKKIELIKDRNFEVTDSDLDKHKKFIETIDDAIWKKHL